MPELFNTSLGLKLSLKEIVAEIIRFMQEDPARQYKITVGSDSELHSGGSADFVTAIVVHRVGNGGRYFWRGGELGTFHTLRDRIIKEVLLSLDLSKELLLALQSEIGNGEKHNSVKWNFEIHADVGENGPTKAMIQEVVGMIRAYDFAVITKPGSYAASNVADRHV